MRALTSRKKAAGYHSANAVLPFKKCVLDATLRLTGGDSSSVDLEGLLEATRHSLRDCIRVLGPWDCFSPHIHS